MSDAGRAPDRVVGLGWHGDDQSWLPMADAWLEWPMDIDEALAVIAVDCNGGDQ